MVYNVLKETILRQLKRGIYKSVDLWWRLPDIMALWLILGWLGCASAQNVNSAKNLDLNDESNQRLIEGLVEENEMHSTDVIDEVVVQGQRSLGSFRRELMRAEDVVFSTFNSLNEDDGYDIVCRREVRIGSQIPFRTCKARLYFDARSSATIGEEYTMGRNGPMIDENNHVRILRQKMAHIARISPEFREALRKRLESEKAYEQARQGLFGEKNSPPE